MSDLDLSGPGPDPRAGRQAVLIRTLQVALLATFVLGVGELLAPSRYAASVGRWMVGVLVLVPVARVLWLVVRWFRRGDVRFGLVGVALLGVLATGLALSR